ncbi:putative multi protein-bridging factor 1 [Naematelia encephala]|uniref:Putative multi protein-bridging factor 1 n=1 Tax=Naematelia encephala TaxID=71784 RepID=A0A1Y2BHI8_9TREE|nr:putative multi protein-bridging factor 1 [Naematelia encephala]
MSDFDAPTYIIGHKANSRPAVARGSDLNAAQRAGTIAGTTKVGGGQSKGPADHGRIAKLDRDDAPKPPEKIDPAVGKAVAQRRMAKIKPDGKAMTQKELATLINSKPQDIQDIESGKATPNQQILGKLERVLDVKLRGSDIGGPLHAPKKKVPGK